MSFAPQHHSSCVSDQQATRNLSLVLSCTDLEFDGQKASISGPLANLFEIQTVVKQQLKKVRIRRTREIFIRRTDYSNS